MMISMFSMLFFPPTYITMDSLLAPFLCQILFSFFFLVQIFKFLMSTGVCYIRR